MAKKSNSPINARVQCSAPGCDRPSKAAGLCSRHYQRLRANGSFELIKRPRPPQTLCSVEGCVSNARSRRGRYCETHYYRMRRTGRFDAPVHKRWLDSTNGYIAGNMPSHPISPKGGFVYQHRVVLFDHIGDGEHHCHWCKKVIGWRLKGPMKLVVDHLDGDKKNNALSNLVASCHKCNATRGLFQQWVAKHKDDPFLWSMYEAAKAA